MYKLKKSSNKNKKYVVTTPKGKKMHFGDSRYEDYTTHKDPERKKNYIKRHRPNEKWSKNGINTKGFWSRWILWNKPTLKKSIEATENKFNIDIKLIE